MFIVITVVLENSKVFHYKNRTLIKKLRGNKTRLEEEDA